MSANSIEKRSTRDADKAAKAPKRPKLDRFRLHEQLTNAQPADEARFLKCWRQPNATDEQPPKRIGSIRLRKWPFTVASVGGLLANDDDECLATFALARACKTLQWQRKHCDLYAFYQTADLANAQHPTLVAFYAFLRHSVQPLVERLTGQRFTGLSASCSLYTAGDRLLAHDDRLADRRIAYVFYVSPWSNATEWTRSMGGALQLFAVRDGGPQFPPVAKLRPRDNQFVFFRVGSTSFHQVAEVRTFDHPRLTINGWFHGPPASDDQPPATGHCPDPSPVPVKRMRPPGAESFAPDDWVQRRYLKADTKHSVQRTVEKQSQIALAGFFRPERYAQWCDEAKRADAAFVAVGPAVRRHYDRMRMPSSVPGFRALVRFLRSAEFNGLLYEYSHLCLTVASVEVMRLGAGSYSLLDDAAMRAPASLDVIVYFVDEDDEHRCGDNAGRVTYVSGDAGSEASSSGSDDEDANDDDDDADSCSSLDSSDSNVLLEIDAAPNTLNIVYRSRGSARFLQYVPQRLRSAGQHVHMLIASYREKRLRD